MEGQEANSHVPPVAGRHEAASAASTRAEARPLPLAIVRAPVSTVLPLVGRAPRSQTGIGARSGPLAQIPVRSGAAQECYGAAPRSPTHPPVDIARRARTSTLDEDAGTPRTSTWRCRPRP